MGGYFGSAFEFSLERAQDQRLLRLKIARDEFMPEVREGAKLYLKLGNGSLVTLFANDTYRGSLSSFNLRPEHAEVRFTLSPAYIIPDAELAVLKTQPVTMVRCYYNTNQYTDVKVYPEEGMVLATAMRVLFP